MKHQCIVPCIFVTEIKIYFTQNASPRLWYFSTFFLHLTAYTAIAIAQNWHIDGTYSQIRQWASFAAWPAYLLSLYIIHKILDLFGYYFYLLQVLAYSKKSPLLQSGVYNKVSCWKIFALGRETFILMIACLLMREIFLVMIAFKIKIKAHIWTENSIGQRRCFECPWLAFHEHWHAGYRSIGARHSTESSL